MTSVDGAQNLGSGFHPAGADARRKTFRSLRLSRAALGDLIGYGSIAIILIASCTKNNTSSIAESEWWSEYTDAGIISTIKAQYALILLFAAGCLALGASRAAVRMPKLRLGAGLLFLLYYYIIIRTLMPAPDLAVKYVLTIVLTLGVALNLALSGAQETIEESCRKLFLAILVSSFWIIATNFYNVLTGNGFVPGGSRLIGVAGHPNFTGVQLALGVPLLMIGISERRLVFSSACVGALLLSLYMLALTGSRTAVIVLMAGVGMTLFLWLRLNLKSAAVLAGLVAPFLIAAFLVVSALGYFAVEQSSAFYRGENTRAETFAYLLNAVAERPFWGLGYFEGFPENSQLRTWAAFGMIAFVLLCAVIFVAAANLRRLLQATCNGGRMSALAGVFCGVVVGSVLEGYLIDAFSYSMMIFVVLVVFCDRAKSISLDPSPAHVATGQVFPLEDEPRAGRGEHR